MIMYGEYIYTYLLFLPVGLLDADTPLSPAPTPSPAKKIFRFEFVKIHLLENSKLEL